ncbi:MAG: hypothetical protein ACLT98_01420 [Eggerthellaceae bacterium]
MGQVASIKIPLPQKRALKRIVCIGGCIGQRDAEKLPEALPHVDVVFGTQNIEHLVSLIEAAIIQRPSGRGAGFFHVIFHRAHRSACILGRLGCRSRWLQ